MQKVLRIVKELVNQKGYQASGLVVSNDLAVRRTKSELVDKYLNQIESTDPAIKPVTEIDETEVNFSLIVEPLDIKATIRC